MKLRHTAALVFVGWFLVSAHSALAGGWYLMAPPNRDLAVIARDAGFDLFGGPPVLRDNVTTEEAIYATEKGDWAESVSRDWIVLGSYDSAESCNSGRKDQLETLASQAKGKKFSDLVKDQYQFFGLPRLVVSRLTTGVWVGFCLEMKAHQSLRRHPPTADKSR